MKKDLLFRCLKRRPGRPRMRRSGSGYRNAGSSGRQDLPYLRQRGEPDAGRPVSAGDPGRRVCFGRKESPAEGRSEREVRALPGWTNPLRAELRSLLEKVPVSRPPALRRSLLPDALFSLDLPRCASPETCEAFLRDAEGAGWRAFQADGWIHLRKAVSILPADFFPDPPSGEAAALLSLLARHPGSSDPSREVILLMKAREEGDSALESACRGLHGDLARRLRRKEAFPALFVSDH